MAASAALAPPAREALDTGLPGADRRGGGPHQRHYLAAQEGRLATRRGRAKAAIAVAHSILIIVYQLLTEGTVYRDLGGNAFDERDRQAVERRLMHRLEGLGYMIPPHPEA